MRLIDGDALSKETGKLWSEMPDGEELSKELMKAINHAPTVDAIPIEPLAVWLAGYRVSPPEYALIQAGAYDEIDPASVAYTASQSAKAWAYHLRKLMESGLMEG